MTTTENPGKVVVFDMDETLGYFIQFSYFWENLKVYFNINEQNNAVKLKQLEDNFNKILGLYPEYIRPNISSVLKYLKHKVEINKCQGVMIYTNNTGPKEWIHHIKDFFDEKINYKLFNHVICAFKVNGKQIEMCRTTYEKTVKDFIKCTKLPENTQICFLDDLFHPKMNYENVYYIKLKAYKYDLPVDEIINRFSNSEIGKKLLNDPQHFRDYMDEVFHTYSYVPKTKEEQDIDKIITKQTMLYLQNFFHSKELGTIRKNSGISIPKPLIKSRKTNKNIRNRTFKKG
jgi:hypothetical protein